MTLSKNIRIYLLATISAVMMALIVYLCMPKRYIGQVTLVDETKEMDVNIGLSTFNSLNGGNQELVTDAAVYQKILTSKEFLDDLRQHHISTNIQHQYINETERLIIRVVESDPVVAAQMVDSVTQHLQQWITKYRRQHKAHILANAEAKRKSAQEKYRDAQRRYNQFVDENNEVRTANYATQENELKQEASARFQQLQSANELYVRELALMKKNTMEFSVLKNSTVSHEPYSPSFIVILAVTLLLALLLTKWALLYAERRRHPNALPIDFGTYFSPWSITILIWVIIIVSVWLEGDRLYPLTSQFYYSIVLWVGIFCMVSFVTYNLMKSADGEENLGSKSIEPNRSLFNLFFTLSVILTPLYVWQVYQVVSQFDMADMMSNIRTLAVHGEALGWLKYTFVINQTIFLVGVCAYPKIPKWQLVTIYLINILCAIAIMEKGSFFMLILCSLFVMYEKRVIKARTIAILGFALVFVFFMFNVIRDFDEDRAETQIDFLDFFAMYVTSPPVAFCQLQNDLTQQLCPNTLQVIYNFLERFNIGDYVVMERNQPFIMVPVITNVYTVMQPFYQDFGHAGVAYFAVVYGIVIGVTYRYYRNGNGFCKVVYTYLVQVLVLQFFQEYLFMMLSALMQMIALIALMTQKKITLSLWK